MYNEHMKWYMYLDIINNINKIKSKGKIMHNGGYNVEYNYGNMQKQVVREDANKSFTVIGNVICHPLI